eukprot:CAMPEP_0182799764 /NCGR_PEP_ID=MMETSP0006_2-20121128/2056_1 /TAXON_ID=97485 /ORGANISM="Prymnesium parvum, Strain Texoma1" /LENGTH=263 /DNA_ID=CAMNT_0024924967 /DNA_START=356 /DNA_END=1148 /DNA_ORIENTATION=+
MNDKITIGQLTKGDVWPAIVPLVRFVRVSGGRVAEHEAGPVLLPWFRGHRYLACLVGRWWIRLGALCLLLHATGPMWLVVPPVLRSPWARANSTASHGSSNGCTCPQPDEGCTSYTGQPIPCHELVLAREFNSAVMPMLQQASYRKIRQAMTQFGLFASAWHVGHACPDPRKGSVTDDEDRGWNLFAQHAADNVRLGHCLVSCSEAEHTGDAISGVLERQAAVSQHAKIQASQLWSLELVRDGIKGYATLSSVSERFDSVNMK